MVVDRGSLKLWRRIRGGRRESHLVRFRKVCQLLIRVTQASFDYFAAGSQAVDLVVLALLAR